MIGTDAAEHARHSPTRLVGSLRAPVLIVHGEEDDITPREQAEAMRDALVKAGKPHEYVMVPGEGHGFFAQKNRLMLYRRLEAFLAKHLAPADETTGAR